MRAAPEAFVRLARLAVVGALGAVAFADVHVAVARIEGDRDRLPQQALAGFLVPVAAPVPLADRLEQLTVGADLEDDRAAGIGEPDIVLGVDREAVRLVGGDRARRRPP